MPQRQNTPMTILPQLIQGLADSLSALGLPERDIKLSPPNNPDFGDLSTNVALTLAKETGQNPVQIANDIKDSLALPAGLIEEISVTPPGFLNFRIGSEYYYQVLAHILADSNYGKGTSGKGQKANVEFVSANPTGPLTVGHGRQAVLGDCVARILEWNGYDVTREYYYNDAGRQMRILGQSVEARYFKIKLPEDGYQGNYIKDIAEKVRTEKGNNVASGDPVFRGKAEEIIFQDISDSLKNLNVHHDIFPMNVLFMTQVQLIKQFRTWKMKDWYMVRTVQPGLKPRLWVWIRIAFS